MQKLLHAYKSEVLSEIDLVKVVEREQSKLHVDIKNTNKEMGEVKERLDNVESE